MPIPCRKFKRLFYPLFYVDATIPRGGDAKLAMKPLDEPHRFHRKGLWQLIGKRQQLKFLAIVTNRDHVHLQVPLAPINSTSKIVTMLRIPSRYRHSRSKHSLKSRYKEVSFEQRVISVGLERRLMKDMRRYKVKIRGTEPVKFQADHQLARF